MKKIIVAISAAFLLACESDKLVKPSLDDEGPSSAKSPQTPETPYVNISAVSETQIDLIWSDVANATGYELYRAESENGEFALLTTTNAKVTTYGDLHPNPATTNCYKVRALRGLGSRTLYSAFSNTSCMVVPPTPPSNVTAAVSSYTMSVAWQDNSNVETAFQVFVSDSESGPFNLRTTTAANVVSWIDEGATSPANYCYRVRAYRTVTTTWEGGSSTGYVYSPESNTACAAVPPPSQPPTAVYQVSAAPFSSSGVNVIMQRITAETQPYSPGYRIRLERSLDGGTLWSVVDTYVLSGYSDYPLTAERTVCYRIIVSNEVGDGQPSSTACTAPPAAPTNLTMFPIDEQSVQLSWTDNSAVEDGYQVWFSYGYGSCSCGASACNADWYEGTYVVAQLPANTTSYVAPPLYGDVCRPTVTSYYVVAINDGGESDQSNWVSWSPNTSP
jgi:hypothetical protein